MPTTSFSSKIVLQVHQLLVDKNDQVTSMKGIVVGKGFQATFQLDEDPEVDIAHGTLERTIGLGIWVYSDHSRQGSILNGKERVHNDAVVVHHGDTLKLGHTEIELNLDRANIEAVPEEDVEEVSPVSGNQEMELSARNVARMARRRASTPWGSTLAMSKVKQAKQRLPRIETSGLGFGELESSTSVEQVTTPLEYTTSPVPGTRWRRKRNSISTTTLAAGRRSPSPPIEQHGHPQSFHRPRARFIQGFEVPSRQQVEVTHSGRPGRPPPLEYSSSPTVSPSSLAARQRHSFSQQPSSTVCVSASGLKAGVPPPPPPPISAKPRPSSRRDDLRIQVSKKMAAAAPVSTEKPRVVLKALEFQAPASPVAQRDILKQQESLQTILQHKFEEEQLLKQQQEEWMRRNVMSICSTNTEVLSGLSSAPQSPRQSKKKSLDIDPDELARFPVTTRAPLGALRHASSQQRTLKSSPRLTAAIQASRVRLNSFEERPDAPSRRSRMERRKTIALVLSPSTIDNQEVSNCSPGKENELRRSDESVVSTATTVIACHRRITSSLSSCASSVDLCDFLGYEDDTEDTITSYTNLELYGPLRRSREDTTLMCDPARNNNVKSAWASSPSRHSPSPGTSGSNNNQDSITSPITSPVSSVKCPKSSHFAPQSPYKSSGASQDNQQALEDADNVEGACKLRQSKLQSFQGSTSFRRHSLMPLTGNNNS